MLQYLLSVRDHIDLDDFLMLSLMSGALLQRLGYIVDVRISVPAEPVRPLLRHSMIRSKRSSGLRFLQFIMVPRILE